MKIFIKLWSLLTPYERRRGILLSFMIIIMALLDAIGVASILPFMTVLSSPNLIESNLYLNKLYQATNVLGVENYQQFLFVLGLFVFFFLITSLIFKALTTYAQIRFSQLREFSIGKRLIEGYLHQPYSWFLNRHSADFEKNILSEVSLVISHGLTPLLDLIARSMVVIAIITLLILADPGLTIIMGFSLGITYFFIFYFIKNYLHRIGKKRLENNQLRFLTVNESFSATKEIKVLGLEENYIKSFAEYAKNCASTQATSQILARLPRFFLEAIAFGGIMIAILYLTSKSGTFLNSIPIISLYVFAGYRLMPAFQNIYASITKLTFVGHSLDNLSEELDSLKFFSKLSEKDNLLFNNLISLKNINYNYPNSSRTALKNINFDILANSKVGFVGATGSGKTTMVDIILGLLETQNGTLEVDGKIINKQNIRSWQKLIGYVPQNIYLSDTSIAENIAFGIKSKDIDFTSVEKASKIANLHDFVTSELPDKYQTTIGERGIRLSGGQAQRIGIARALYHNPKILILDEATSSLDFKTEKVVMDAINNLGNEVTIILIAHRLSTVKNCDKIFLFDKGSITNHGSYEELIKDSESFRENVRTN